MGCNKCASENQRTFKCECVLNFHEFENLDRGPVYLSENMLVCLDCGHSEIVIPKKELDRLAVDPGSRKQGRIAGRQFAFFLISAVKESGALSVPL